MRQLKIVVAVLLFTGCGLSQQEKSLAGDWLMFARQSEEAQDKGPGILVTFRVEGEKVSGKAAGPRGDWPLSEIRYDGQTLSFRVHNGEEFLEARLKRSGQEFEGSFIGSESRESGRLRMRRKK